MTVATDLRSRQNKDRRRRAGGFTRGHLHTLWDLAFRSVRWLAGHARNAYTAFGLILLAGAAVAVGFTWIFTELAGHVTSGRTQRFDDAVMAFVARHQYPFLESVMLEVTALGTGLVVMILVLVSGVFLWLNHHKHSAALLVIATLGGLLLNNLLKVGFDRPRPSIFEWGTKALSSSFPSGHAMSAAVVYGTVAYLAARLQKSHASRVATLTFAFILILLISASRVYLGVHYPSDVLAGLVIGLAWAAFCMATLEAAQLWAKRNAPQMLKEEHPAPATENGGGMAEPLVEPIVEAVEKAQRR